MFGLSEDPQIFQSISLTIELGYKCPIMPLEKMTFSARLQVLEVTSLLSMILFYYILANLNLESDQSCMTYTRPSHLCQQDQFSVGLSVRNLQDS